MRDADGKTMGAEVTTGQTHGVGRTEPADYQAGRPVSQAVC